VNTFWVYFAALALLSWSWSRVERRVQLLREGLYLASLGYERTGLVLSVTQGVLSLALFGMIGAAFWLFSWQAGVGFALTSLWIASWR
jgi:hypothetical protein